MDTRHITFESCCKTDMGKEQSVNKDVCFADNRLHCYLVADGMGGASEDQTAGALFRQATDERFSEETPGSVSEAIALIRSCFHLAHTTIQQYSENRQKSLGMGCTADLLTFHSGHCIIGHVGDSRTYHFRNNCLTQLTTDHALTPPRISQETEDSTGQRQGRILYQAVGVDMAIDVDIYSKPVEPDCHFLICSDGLYTMVSDEEISAVLAYDAPLALKAEMLVNMANDNGGRDNITVTMIRLTETK